MHARPSHRLTTWSSDLHLLNVVHNLPLDVAFGPGTVSHERLRRTCLLLHDTFTNLAPGGC